MVEWSLANLAAWFAQVAALVAAGVWLPTRLRLGAPRARLVVFRALLIACVLLPFLQPWQVSPSSTVTTDAAPDALEVTGADAYRDAGMSLRPNQPAAKVSFERARTWALSVPWTRLTLVALVVGTLLRLAWLGLGLVSLLRLRRTSTPIDPALAAIEAAGRVVGVTAPFRESPRVQRPVTFGLRAPVVLVPPGFVELDPSRQLAIACHELLHVRRQDWLRTLGDEIVRAGFWFHPAIWWLVEQIHLSAEQMVDRTVVSLVGDRRAYLQALLALAESGAGPRLQPAACFLDHGHLRQRVAMLMEEASMSRVRLVASFALVLTVLMTGGWFVVQAFPLRAGAAAPAVVASNHAPAPGVLVPPSTPAPTPPTTPAQATTAPPLPPVSVPVAQAPRPGMPTGTPAGGPQDEATLKQRIQFDPKDTSNYFMLGKLYEKAGDVTRAEATYKAAVKAAPKGPNVYVQLADFYKRQGDFDKTMDALVRWVALEPDNLVAHYIVGAFYWEKAYRDSALTEAQKRGYIDQGLDAVNAALRLNADYIEALTYKNLLLRSQALLETDPAAQKTLTDEADRLRDRANELRKERVAAGAPAATYTAVGVTGGTAYAVAPPPPPPPPPAATVGGQAPVRVGGNIRPPQKIVDVKPVYPEDAKQARVQGVVIIEATIDQTGKVTDARVLRSIPMLDQAALDAVKQWVFTPTVINDTPVPVIMTVTVNFTLD